MPPKRESIIEGFHHHRPIRLMDNKGFPLTPPSYPHYHYSHMPTQASSFAWAAPGARPTLWSSTLDLAQWRRRTSVLGVTCTTLSLHNSAHLHHERWATVIFGQDPSITNGEAPDLLTWRYQMQPPPIPKTKRLPLHGAMAHESTMSQRGYGVGECEWDASLALSSLLDGLLAANSSGDKITDCGVVCARELEAPRGIPTQLRRGRGGATLFSYMQLVVINGMVGSLYPYIIYPSVSCHVLFS